MGLITKEKNKDRQNIQNRQSSKAFGKMAKAKTKKGAPEHYLQVDCIRFFRETYPNYIIFSTNNEACYRRKDYWKDSGLLVGVSDCVAILPKAVIFLELKSDKGRQRPDQKHFEDKLAELGYRYYIIRTLEEFKDAIKENIE